MSIQVMPRLALGVLLGLFSLQSSFAQDDAEFTPEQQAAFAQMQKLMDALEPRGGEIALGDDLAVLNVPEDFYFLDSDDAATVLVDLWGNPPGQDVLGMLFPAGISPLDGNAWAVTVEYVEDGHVSDSDAAEIDYDDLLKDMQADIRNANDERIDAGYQPIELLGWAEPPHYDSSAKKLYWAKELRFGDDPNTILNYEIRNLGRKGILNLTFIAGSDQLAEINDKRETVLAMADFVDGNRYADFDSSIDKVAAYGIGALVAGKVAAKAGLFAALFLVLKKFAVFLVLGIGAFWRRLKGVFATEKLGP
jgi:uncharacterized membrane-anchored protein